MPVREFVAIVEYRDLEGKLRNEEFPVRIDSYPAAKEMAERYVLEVMKLQDFELRIAGA
jgi:hypothetical protein